MESSAFGIDYSEQEIKIVWVYIFLGNFKDNFS